MPNRILDKPARLTSAEWEIVKLYPYYTHQILERVPVFGELAFDASAHHERFDGRGYFRNLPASQLSEPARILCAADQLDALSAERPYRGKLPPERVMEIMRGEGPTLIECKTYRWHGHSEHDKAFYRSDEELAMWKSRDPIPTFTTYLRARHVLDDAKLQETEQRVKTVIDDAVEYAANAKDPEPGEAVTDLYA